MTSLFELGDYRIKAEIGHCFRCIIRCGKDPTILRVDQVEWTTDGTKLQLVDHSLIQSIFRESGTVSDLVQEFISSVKAFSVEREEYTKITSRNQLQSRGNEPTTSSPTRTSQSTEFDSDDEKSPEMSQESPVAGSGSGGDYLEAMKIKVKAAQTVTQTLLNLCIDLCRDDMTGLEMCKCRVCDGAIQLLGIVCKDSVRDERIAVVVDLLWTVLESYLGHAKYDDEIVGTRLDPTLTSLEVLDFEIAMKVLLKVLVQMLREGFRLEDKECRNEVAIVMTLISHFPPALPFFVQSGGLNALVTYSCVVEAGKKAWSFYSKPLANIRNFGGTSDIDLQFKQSLWLLVSNVLSANDPDMLVCVASSPLMSTMLQYLEFDSVDPHMRGGFHDTVGSQAPSEASPTSSKLSRSRLEASEGKSQSKDYKQAASLSSESRGDVSSNAFISLLTQSHLRSMQLVAMKFLAQNAVKIMGEFLRVDGPVRVLDVMIMYFRSAVDEHKAIVYHAVILLMKCASASNIVKLILEEENAIQSLLFLFESSDDDACRSQAIRLASFLCTGSKACQKQLRTQDGVKIIVNTIRTYAAGRRPLVGRKAGLKMGPKGDNSIEDPSEDPKTGDIPVLIAATLDCIRNGVLANSRSETVLAKEEGMDALMELLEVSPYVLRFPVLRLLSDLLENEQLVRYLQAWRSVKSIRSAAQLLAHSWLDDEVRLNTKRDNGIICNILDPLSNHDWAVDDSVKPYTDSTTFEESSRSLAVTRLADAILAGRKVTEGGVPSYIRAKVLDNDARGLIANVFQLLGVFDAYMVEPDSSAGSESGRGPNGTPRSGAASLGGEEVEGDADGAVPILRSSGMDLRLTPVEKQVVAIAHRYAILREGEWWTSVAGDLLAAQVRPIEADLTMMEQHLERYFDGAMEVQLHQMELLAEDKRLKQRQEDNFVRDLKELQYQQIKAEWLRRNGRNKVASRKK